MTVTKKLVLIFVLVFMLSGCQSNPVASIVINDQTFSFESFTPGAIESTFIYEDGTQERVPFTMEWVETRDVEKLSRPGHHVITISEASIQTTFDLVLESDVLAMQLSNIYTLGSENQQIGTDYDTWKASIAGEDGLGVDELFINALGELVVTYTDETQVNLGRITGEDAPLIELDVDGELLTWNYVDEADREVLFDLSTLKGDTGTSIEDLSFNADEELVVTFDDGTQNNLGSFSAFLDTLAIDTLYTNSRSELIIVLTDGRSFNLGSVIGPVGPRGETGPRGIQGPRGLTGPQGAPGESPEFRIDGIMMQYKYPSEDNTKWRDLFNFQTLESETYSFVTSPGVVLRTTSDTLQWKLDEEPDTSFQTLFTAQELTGPTGPQGPAGTDGADGADGAELEIRYNTSNEQIETRYVGEETWTSIASKATFQGPRGYDLSLSTSGNAIVWGISDGAIEYAPLVDFEDLKAPPAEIIVSGEAIYSRGLSTDPYTFVISLSALEGPVGPEGRGISGVAIDGSNHFIITYTDGVSDNLGTLASLLNVSFRHPSGYLFDTQIVASGSDLTTPSSIPSVAYATVSGFTAPLTNITESKIIETVLAYETLTVAFSNELSSLTLTALDALSLPTPAAPEGYTFAGFYRLINGQKVPAYDGMPLDALFLTDRSITLRPSFEVIERFDVRNEEDRIRMIDEVLNGIITVENEGEGIGSGVVVSASSVNGTTTYYAVTNEHVVRGHTQVNVYYFIGGNRYKIENVTVEVEDGLNDVAVLSFPSTHDFEVIPFADHFSIDTGQTVYAIGNPRGIDFFHTVTEGILVSDRRYLSVDPTIESYFIQHSAVINPGNSGGPIIDSNGHILGLNSYELVDRYSIDETIIDVDIEGLAFAVGSKIVERVLLDVLDESSSVARLSLGIDTSTNPTTCKADQKVGVCITSVTSSSYAEELGLAVNDIIIQFKNEQLVNYVNVDNPDELTEALYATQVGAAISVVYLDASDGYNEKTSGTSLD